MNSSIFIVFNYCENFKLIIKDQSNIAKQVHNTVPMHEFNITRYK